MIHAWFNTLHTSKGPLDEVCHMCFSNTYAKYVVWLRKTWFPPLDPLTKYNKTAIFLPQKRLFHIFWQETPKKQTYMEVWVLAHLVSALPSTMGRPSTCPLLSALQSSLLHGSDCATCNHLSRWGAWDCHPGRCHHKTFTFHHRAWESSSSCFKSIEPGQILSRKPHSLSNYLSIHILSPAPIPWFTIGLSAVVLIMHYTFTVEFWWQQIFTILTLLITD